MYYGDLLEKLLKKEQNPVNRMYLNEIKIKWGNFEKESENIETSNEILINTFNEFLKKLNNKKFKFVKTSSKGFKPDSELFSPKYIDDLISVIMQRKSILKHSGIVWGKQQFTTGLQLNPSSFLDLQDTPNFEHGQSPELLVLTQHVNFQFKIAGKHRFNKYLINYPLIVFLTFRNLTQDDLIKSEYYATMAKKTFSKSKLIIVTEMLDTGIIHDIQTSLIDTIFVLRKQFVDDVLNPISTDILNALEQKIDNLLEERFDLTDNFIETGLIN